MILRREIKVTDDGSKTLFIPDWNENYHSTHGAVQEAKHVFLEYGLGAIENKEEINVFEVGFGTGLNAILTYQYAIENQKSSDSKDSMTDNFGR